MRTAHLLPLLLIAVAATGCGSSSGSAMPLPADASLASGGPIDVCQYLTRPDAEAMLGVPTGPGKLKHVLDTDSTCDYVPDPATVLGTRLALTVYTGDFVGQTLDDLKKGYKDMVPVDGLGIQAMRTADGAVFASQNDKRACMLIMSVKKPADPDAFAKQVGAVCRKALAG
ncbi:hypothetical protein [Kutzneria sp. NPDC051319]|uniref:hypothetical protein n=1 Tax=Kutzneria sp. NPDC051319 TaxID=3155047 RepID=UPI00342FA0C7